jgi:hypothetical protein
MDRLIGITGFAGSGKDTVADYLCENFNFTRLSFAQTVKDILSVIFGWDRFLLEGRTKESREWRETEDVWWANKLNIPDLTPRKMMQFIGTDVLRDHFHNDIWIAALERKILDLQRNVVVTDCRFPNEIAAIKQLGGSCIRIKRGPEPEWYNDALYLNQKTDTVYKDVLMDRLLYFNVHESEYAWIGQKFDFIINNTDIKSLYNEVQKTINLIS